MCGRYLFSETDNEELRQIKKTIDSEYGEGAWRSGEIRPTNMAPVLIGEGSTMRPRLLSWGFRTAKSLVINARAETVREKPLFRDAITKNRCVIPSSGFYEWDAAKRKYRFTLPGNPTLYMAGIFADFEGVPCFCILTTAANASMESIHDRMPLVLQPKIASDWLHDSGVAEDILRQAPPLLDRESEESQLSLW